jgi:hypothetical protein
MLLLVCALVACLTPSAVGMCVGYGKTECLAHSDECVLCRAFDRLDLCFAIETAKKLPGEAWRRTCHLAAPQSNLLPLLLAQPSCSHFWLPGQLAGTFKCDWPAPEPAAPACDDLAQPACGSTAGCVWCISAAVPSQCYSEEDAKRCGIDTLLRQSLQALVGSLVGSLHSAAG